MLQFDKSKTTNSNAAYIDTVNTSSSYYDSLILTYSQSLDNSNGTMEVTTVSSPTQYTHWLIFQNSGSQVPSPSGQYNIDLFTGTLIPAIWNQVNVAWDSYNEFWDNAGILEPNVLIYSDRAYVSGSNESNIKQYVSPDENGTYITYNG
jgi:hypothetical protein